LFAKPYSPESTGKCERWNRTVDSFLQEAKAKKLSTLDGYNHFLKVWIQEVYHARCHASLMDTPENVYKTSKIPLRFTSPEQIADAFLHCEERKVDKSGCIRFDNKLYDVGIPLIGQKVDIVFDPTDKSTLTVEHKPTGYVKGVSELIVGPYAGKRPKLPDTYLAVPCETSRLLDLKEAQYLKNQDNIRRAIRYSDLPDGINNKGNNLDNLDNSDNLGGE